MSNPKQNKKELLGKGIRSLLQGIDSDLKTGAGTFKTCRSGKCDRHQPYTG